MQKEDYALLFWVLRHLDACLSLPFDLQLMQSVGWIYGMLIAGTWQLREKVMKITVRFHKLKWLCDQVGYAVGAKFLAFKRNMKYLGN